MAEKKSPPFLIINYGPKDIGKSFYLAALAKIANSGQPITWQGETWKLTYHGIELQPSLETKFTTKIPPAPVFPLSPTDPTLLGVYGFKLTRSSGSSYSGKNSQEFILCDPSGGIAFPEIDNTPKQLLFEKRDELNSFSLGTFGKNLSLRVDLILFVNSSIKQGADILVDEPEKWGRRAYDYLKMSLDDLESRKKPIPCISNFTVYFSASELTFMHGARQSLEKVLAQVNSSPHSRMEAYKDAVYPEYRSYVSSFMTLYAEDLKTRHRRAVEVEPFFGSPPGQTLEGRKNWNSKRQNMVEPMRWQPLFVVEPLIELVRLGWGEPS